jgi:hypothetical protein
MRQRLLARLMRVQCLPVQAALAAVFAGTAATIVQVLLWWLSATPVFETLLRDARLTAAIIMGSGVLAGEPVWRGDVLLIATLIHFGLSFIYAAIALPVARCPGTAVALLAGGVYGLAIYVVNLYGFTLIFPWFDVSRGWVTILTHVAFGVSLIWACRAFDSGPDATDKLRYETSHGGAFSK